MNERSKKKIIDIMQDLEWNEVDSEYRKIILEALNQYYKEII